MKFCCLNFETHYRFRNTLAHSIRIVRYSSEEFLNNGNINLIKQGKNSTVKCKGNDMRFLLMTSPYVVFDQLKNPAIMLNFCPFCGANLYKFYRNKEYANEVEGVTFSF